MARLANSLVRLRDQVNAAYPSRSKASDGWIGDAAHASSASDHNPNSQGVVNALDLTNDPANGFDAHALADRLRQNRHPNLRYIISNGRIASAGTNWAWGKYSGSNPHSKHIHVSVGQPTTTTGDGKSTSNNDDASDWNIKGATTAPKRSNDVIAAEVIAGAWGNGTDRQNRLRAAGYDPGTIQSIVNQKLGGGKPAPAPAPQRPSNSQVADQVIAGAWGSGPERKRRLAAAGYDYNAVQSLVNQKLGAGPAVPARKSDEQIANEIIAGKWGNGKERSARVSAAGYNYAAIQKIVNRKLGF